MIAGNVRDAVTGDPLAGANVFLRGTVRGTTTGPDGTFRLRSIPEGVYVVVASLIGYESAAFPVTVAGDVSSDALEIRLKPAPVQTDQVVVTASRREQSLQEVPVSMAVVDARQIAARAAVTVDEALRYVSGVNMTMDQVNIRGSSGYSRGVGSRVLLLIDGLPFITGDTGEISWEALPVYQIDHIEIVKAAGSALYGSSALGGVINIITKPIPERAEVRLGLSAGMYDRPRPSEWNWWSGARFNTAGLVSLSTRSGSFGALASVTRSVDDSYRVNDVYHRWNFFTKLAYAFTPTQELSILGNVNLRSHGNFFWWRSLRQATRPADAQLNGNVDSKRGNVSLAFRDLVNDRFFYTLKATYVGNFWRDDSAGRTNNTSASHVTQVEAQATWNAEELGVLTGGIAGNYDVVHSDIFGTHPGVGAAAYAQLEVPVNNVLKVTAGLRVDWQKVSALPSDGRAVPKLGVTWTPVPWTTLRASFGSGFRYPSISEIFTSVTTGVSQVRIVPNENLKPERSESYELGILQRVADELRCDLAVFQNDFRDLIEASVDPGRLVIEFNNVTRARIRGAEISVNSEWLGRHLLIDGGYTYMDPVDLGTNEILKFRPRHLLYATLTVAVGPARFSVDGRYISRMEAIDENLVHLAPILQGDTRVPIKVMDVRLSWDLLLVRLGLSAKNALNYHYVELIGNLAPVRTFVLTLDTII